MLCDCRSSRRSQRSLRRVRSFPIVADEDDVAAGQKKDQKVKKTKAVKKASQEAVSARNPAPLCTVLIRTPRPCGLGSASLVIAVASRHAQAWRWPQAIGCAALSVVVLPAALVELHCC